MINLLLIDDDKDMVKLMEVALKRVPWKYHFTAISYMDEILDFFRKGKTYARIPKPDLIISDYLLPGITGEDTIHWIRTDPDLKEIPTVLLTGYPDFTHQGNQRKTFYREKSTSFEGLQQFVNEIPKLIESARKAS